MNYNVISALFEHLKIKPNQKKIEEYVLKYEDLIQKKIKYGYDEFGAAELALEEIKYYLK